MLCLNDFFMRKGRKQLIIVDDQKEEKEKENENEKIEEKENKKIDQNYIKQDENYSSNKQESNSSDDEEDSKENYNHIKDDEEDLLEDSLKLDYNHIKDTEDDGVPNEEGIIQNGPNRGKKDHTENSPYAEDCFLLALTENSQLYHYNPERYSVFSCLSSGAARKYALRNYKQLAESISNYDENIDEYLNKKVSHKRIDEFIEKVKKSPSKAVKIVISAHGNYLRTLWRVKDDSAAEFSERAGEYQGTNDLFGENVIECIEYLFKKLEEVGKNINIVNTACYAAEYFDDKQKQSIMPMIKNMAQAVKKKNSKNVIYTCNYSDTEPHFGSPKSLNRYYRYDDKKDEFVAISPKLEDDKCKEYSKYCEERHDKRKKMRENEKKKTQQPEEKEKKIIEPKKEQTRESKLKQIDLQTCMAYLMYIKEKLESFGATDKEKEWAKEEIEDINCSKGSIHLQSKMMEINEFILTLENLLHETVTIALMKSFPRELTKIKNFKKFAQQNPLCFRDDGIMPNGVKKYHRRKRSYELFFDNETVDEMKKAKEKKNKLLFELEPNIEKNISNEPNTKENISNKPNTEENIFNDEYSLTNGWYDEDEDKEKIKKESKINLKELNGTYYFSDL